MNIYCRWYYWYKNLGDELLLFGVLERIHQKFPDCSVIDIEAWDQQRLQTWLDRHTNYLPKWISIRAVEKNFFAYGYDHVVIGWGEVLSDARPVPYNGRVHVIRFWKHILSGSYSLLWWVWTRKRRHSWPLFKLLLSRAKLIVLREQNSYNNASMYVHKNNITLYKDFAIAFFEQHSVIKASKQNNQSAKKKWFIINTNPYLRNEEVRQKIVEEYATTSTLTPYFVPAEIGSDEEAYSQLKQDIPKLQRYDRTVHTVSEIVTFFSSFKAWVATRLHVMILLHELDVPYLPLVYQEKITHLLGHDL